MEIFFSHITIYVKKEYNCMLTGRDLPTDLDFTVVHLIRLKLFFHFKGQFKLFRSHFEFLKIIQFSF